MNYKREADRLFSLLVRQENADEDDFLITPKKPKGRR